jgi:hypothetical protein
LASKLQLITAMYERQTQTVTARIKNWQAFLLSASRNYKLPFDEQILIHAQRPEATAVLEIEKWNNQFGRWVNKGATGIAVVDKSVPGKMRLKHYFDIADTHGSRFERPVPLWDMKPDYEPEVIETLEATFGELESAETLAEAIFSAASNAVDDNITDYLADLLNYREDSFLEELDELNVEVFYKRALTASISYMLLSRCGLDPNEYLIREDFEEILNFNTPQTAGLLGTATSDIAEMGLREIAKTVLSLEKSAREQIRTFDEPTEIKDNITVTQNIERSNEHGSVDIQRGERVSDSRPDRAGGAGSRAWKVRPHAPQLSSEPPQGTVHGTADERQSEQPSDGNRADGGTAVGTPERTDGESRGRDGSLESIRPDGVDTGDDQHPQPGGGNDTERPHLQLSFPTQEQQQQSIEEAGVTGLRTPTTPAFSLPIPIEELDNELTRGSGFFQGKFRIYQHYQDLGTQDEHVKFLRDEFGTGGHSPLDGSEYSVSSDSKGLTFQRDKAALQARHTIPWAKVSKRLEQLIAADRYLSERDKAEFYPQYLEYQEQQKILRGKEAFIDKMAKEPNAEKRDSLSLRLSDFINGLERYEKNYLEKHGLEEFADAVSIEQIDALLQDPRQTAQMTDALTAIQGATSSVYVRNNSWRFGLELKDIHPREYAYHLGDTVHIGDHEYEVLSFDNERVTLFDTEFPLMNK